MTDARRSSLADLLDRHRTEIEQKVFARARAVSDPAAVGDAEYERGLRTAVAAAISYGFAGLEAPSRQPTIPGELLAQARSAARNGVPLDTVLRRYTAGYTLLCDFLIEQARPEGALSGSRLSRLLRRQTSLLDRLLACVSEEHTRETEARRSPTAEQRRATRVRSLLAGEPVDLTDIVDYELDAWHLGAVASGHGTREALRRTAAELECRILWVPAGCLIWAWFGGPREISPREALRLAGQRFPTGVRMALGEPGRGAEGWRLTHRQARAAMAVAQEGPVALVRYGEVALQASALGDDVLASSLRETYLAPLERGPDGGVILRRTLAAYFAASRNGSSAAAALGVSRKTVSARLRSAEERIGQPIDCCAAELETALKLRG